MDTKEVFLQWFKNFLIKRSHWVQLKITVSNQRPSDSATLQLAEESHEPIISKFEKPIVHSSYKDNIWGADLADKDLISKFNDRIPFLL